MQIWQNVINEASTYGGLVLDWPSMQLLMNPTLWNFKWTKKNSNVKIKTGTKTEYSGTCIWAMKCSA